MSESAARALEELEASLLFDADFPRRVSYTAQQYRELMNARSAELHRPGLEAIERARSDYARLEGLVTTLGRERYEPAVPTLAQLWRDCALQPVWVQVGHALFAIATPEAMDALRSLIEDHDNFARHMAFKSVFIRGSSEAFDYFERNYGITDGEHWLLAHILSFLEREGEDIEPAQLLSDTRWIDLCARYRTDRMVGYPAREVLRIAPAKAREAAIRKAKSLETPPVSRTRRDGELLTRYQRGDFEQVWRDIRTHPRIDGEFRCEVLEVAEATMTRVAHNADLIAERLQALGWQPLYADYHGLRTPPKSTDDAVFARIEDISGAPVPPTLLAFWRVVGGSTGSGTMTRQWRSPTSDLICPPRNRTHSASMLLILSPTCSMNGSINSKKPNRTCSIP